MRLSPIDAARLVRAAGFPYRDPSGRNPAAIMVACGWSESGLKSNAKGGPNKDGSFDYGWLQVNSVHGNTYAEMSDPVKCTAVAFSLYTGRDNKKVPGDKGDFQDWATYNSGVYLVHLPAAKLAVAAVIREENYNAKRVAKGQKPKALFPGLYGPGQKGSGAIAPTDPYGPDPTGVIPGIGYVPGGSVVGAAGAAWDAANAVPHFLSMLGDRNTWIRTAEIFFGGIFLLGGLAILARELGAADTAATIAKAPAVAKVASAAAKVAKGAGK